jgi:hypothetical protein
MAASNHAAAALEPPRAGGGIMIPSFSELLMQAVTEPEPGIVSSAYSQFHNYSLGNQILAGCSVAPGRFNLVR